MALSKTGTRGGTPGDLARGGAPGDLPHGVTPGDLARGGTPGDLAPFTDEGSLALLAALPEGCLAALAQAHAGPGGGGVRGGPGGAGQTGAARASRDRLLSAAQSAPAPWALAAALGVTDAMRLSPLDGRPRMHRVQPTQAQAAALALQQAQAAPLAAALALQQAQAAPLSEEAHSTELAPDSAPALSLAAASPASAPAVSPAGGAAANDAGAPASDAAEEGAQEGVGAGDSMEPDASGALPLLHHFLHRFHVGLVAQVGRACGGRKGLHRASQRVAACTVAHPSPLPHPVARLDPVYGLLRPSRRCLRA